MALNTHTHTEKIYDETFLDLFGRWVACSYGITNVGAGAGRAAAAAAAARCFNLIYAGVTSNSWAGYWLRLFTVPHLVGLCHNLAKSCSEYYLNNSCQLYRVAPPSWPILICWSLFGFYFPVWHRHSLCWRKKIWYTLKLLGKYLNLHFQKKFLRTKVFCLAKLNEILITFP